jgi:uncharacterized protein (TIGR00375 family)
LLIATHEYNYLVSGVLKKALNCALPPKGDNPLKVSSPDNDCIHLKIWWSKRPLPPVQKLVFLNNYPINNPEVIISDSAQNVDENGGVTNPQTRQLIKKQSKPFTHGQLSYDKRSKGFLRKLTKALKQSAPNVMIGHRHLRVIADLHIHGKYSRATSEQMSISEIAKYAKIKGLSLVGTGDFTHPTWLKEAKDALIPDGDSGLYKPTAVDSSMRFMLQTEVCTIFNFKGESKKVHHVIFTPSFETAMQVNERLAKFGSLTSDGRPILDATAPQLVEEVMAVSIQNMIFPAHAWTPWFSIFGAFSGFDTMEDCYQDMTKHIHALETGLSSDPPMNWRLSKLDRYTLLSNSDCHSFWPWRIGREANVFDLEKLTYSEVIDAIIANDPKRLKFTIETDPAYGKYHWTGHRNCKISLSTTEATKFGNICPVCRRKLTKGVEQRVEELADRPCDFKRDMVPTFKRLLPLSEIIAAVLGTDSPSTQAVWHNYNGLVDKFGDEYTVLMDTPLDALESVVDAPMAQAIIKVREGTAKVTPGYDGVYGQLALGDDARIISPKASRLRIQQTNMSDFFGTHL